MKRTTTLAGLGTLFAINFASVSAVAEETVAAEESVIEGEPVAAEALAADGEPVGAAKPATVDRCADAYETPIEKLQKEKPECYKELKDWLDNGEIAEKLRKAEKFRQAEKLRQNAPLHLFLGELQLVTDVGASNEFQSENGFTVVTTAKRERFWGVEGGYFDKKWLRDIWAAAKPYGYLGQPDWARNAFIDALTLTLKAGYKRGLSAFDEDDPMAPQSFENRMTFTVKAAYTLKLDKAYGVDID